MSANRRRRGPTPKRGSQSSAPGPAAARPLESEIKEEVTARMKQRLGLAENEQIPPEIQEIVDSAAREIAESTVATAVTREVENVARRLRPSSINASGGAQAVTPASDLPLLEEAKYLATRKKALEAMGFSSEEAMRIIVAEVAGGGSQS
jgi:hypothetical protein